MEGWEGVEGEKKKVLKFYRKTTKEKHLVFKLKSRLSFGCNSWD